jgi:MFS family permease
VSTAVVRPPLSGLGSPAAVYPGAFLVAFGEGMLNLGIVFFLRERGAGSGLIGWFMAYSVLVYMLGCLLLQQVFDRLRPQTALLASLFGMPAFLLLLVLLPALPLTFLFSGLYRLALAFFWPPAMGWLSQGVEGEALSRRQARFNLSWSTGLVSSYALAGLASQRDTGLPLVLAIAAFAGYALVLAAMLAASPTLRAAAPAAAGSSRRGVARPPAGSSGGASAAGSGDRGEGTPLRYPAWVGMFASYVVSGMVATVFPLFAQDVLGATRGVVGSLVSSRTLLQSAGFLVLGAVSFWHHRGRWLVASQVYLALLLCAMLFARSVAFYAVLFPLLGLASAFNYAGGLFHGIAGSSRRAARMAMHESTLNGGYIVGASASGLLYQQFSMRAVVVFCLGSSLAAILTQGLLLSSLRGRGRR